jgi:D-amino-acid oxidase
MIEFGRLGGELEARTVQNLGEVANCGRFDVVVNCTGLGARALLGDDRVKALRGQITRVYAPGVRHFYFDENDVSRMTYIIPRRDLVVLGGTAQMGDYSTAVRSDEVGAIMARCAALDPALKDAKVVTHWAGLRPFRDAVRCELERGVLTNGSGGGPRTVLRVPVVHNYGHGGSGVTIAWGCAVDVVRLAEAALSPARL